MVDEERLARLLDRLSADARTLRGLRQRLAAGDDDPAVLGAVKYHFITVIETCARVAQHIVVAQEWPVAETNADGVRRLAAGGVLDEATGEAVARAVGFRNVLVHEYTQVDDAHVRANLDRLDDLELFAEQVARWLSPPGADPG